MKRATKSKQHQAAAKARALKLTARRRQQISGKAGARAAKIQRALRALAGIVAQWERGAVGAEQVQAALAEARAAGWREAAENNSENS